MRPRQHDILGGWLTRIAVVLAIALLVLILAARLARAAWPYDSVCDIANSISSGGASGGSGTYVGAAGKNGAVLTCAHLFDQGVGQIVCTFPASEYNYRAKVLGIDWEHDLALLLIRKPAGIKPLRIARVNPGAGPFVSIGFPAHAHGSRHYRVSNLVGQTAGESYTDVEFQSGDSGGALLDRRGRLVGVTVGNDGVPDQPYMIFDHSRSVSNDALINFASRWVKIYQ